MNTLYFYPLLSRINVAKPCFNNIFSINKDEKNRERKKYEPGQALGAFKIVNYYDNLTDEFDELGKL